MMIVKGLAKISFLGIGDRELGTRKNLQQPVIRGHSRSYATFFLFEVDNAAPPT